MADPYDRTQERDVVLNLRTLAMLRIAEEKIGFRVTLTQGSYNRGGVKASAGTHDGGGVFDVRAKNLTRSQRDNVVRELRRIGFAAWLRRPEQADPPWPLHIHAVAIGDREMSDGAKKQVNAYLDDPPRNGLKGGGRDDGPRVKFTEFPQTLLEDDVALSDEDKTFLRNLVHGLDKTIRVVGRDHEGAQVEDMVTLGGRLLLIQDDTDDIQRRLSLLSATVGTMDDKVLAGITAKVGPIVAAELKKAPNLTVDEVNKAVALALREAFAPDEAPTP
jgi:hypothetical protein